MVTALCFPPTTRTPVSSACASRALELRDMPLPHHAQDGGESVLEVSEPFHCKYRGSLGSIYFQNNGSSTPTLGMILCAQGRH